MCLEQEHKPRKKKKKGFLHSSGVLYFWLNIYSQFTFFFVTKQNPIQANIKLKQTSCLLCIYINIETIHQWRKMRKQKLKLFGYKISKDIRTYNNYKANKTPKNQHPLPNTPEIFFLFLQTQNRRTSPCGIWSNRCTTNRTSNDLGKPRVNTPHLEHVTISREISTPLGVFESVKADHTIIVSSRNDVAVAVVGLATF